jgi:hypothetical protein
MSNWRPRIGSRACTVLFCLGAAGNGTAQLEVVLSQQALAVFSGDVQSVPVILRNAGEKTVNASLSIRLFQWSATTRMPIGAVQEWKQLTVLSGQTVLEQAAVQFPEVRAATRFEVRWLGEGQPLGQTMVAVYPTNILKQLGDLAGDRPVGVFDPHEQLTPLWRALKLEFDDLTEGQRLETWRGRIALIGPFDPKQTIPAGYSKHAAALAERGIGVVLLATNSAPELRATVLVVNSPRRGRLVMASPETVAGIATNAASQLALLRLARLAASTNRFPDKDLVN